MSNGIRYLERAAVDVEKWNRCIDESANGLIYAHSWWLDHMADNWSALVLNDYDAVMPLTWKHKYGFHYLYQPWFTLCLGVFKKPGIPIALVDFFKSIPGKYRLWDFQVNEYTMPDEQNSFRIQVVERTNHFVRGDVNDYAAIAGSYSRLCRRKLAKALKEGLRVAINEEKPGTIITMYQQEYAKEHPDIEKKVYDQLAACCTIAFDKGLATIYTAISPAGETQAFYLVLHDKQYAYSLIGGSTANGKETGAFYLLTDAAIKQAAQHNHIFRFEGSDIPGIAFFNRQFASVVTHYSHIKRNALPFWAKWLKRL